LQPHDLFALFTGPLEALQVPYFVTGSVASLYYGEPRLTHDIDVVVTLRDADVERLAAIFPEEAFYRPPSEVLRVELRRPQHGHFNLIHHATGFKADVYLTGANPLHAWALSHRRRSGEGPRSFWLAPPEYVIVRKLEFFREGGSGKHLRDIRGMLASLGADLDRQALAEWIDRMGLQAQWGLIATPEA
jgi:hypothetical protein